MPAPSRRRLLAILAATAGAIAAGGAPGARADDTATAAAFIEKLLHDLTEVTNDSQPREEKQAAAEKLVDANVDVTDVARFCLGRFWRTATPEQQRDYLALFRRVLLNSVTSKIGDYQGVTFTMGRTGARDDTIDVPTIVTRPSSAPNRVEWIVRMTAAGPKIVDVIAEGVSLRLTQRSDYAAYLQRNNNNVQALIDAMRRQANNPQG